MGRSRVRASRVAAPLLAAAGSLIAHPGLADKNESFISPGILFSVELAKPYPFGLGAEFSFHTYPPDYNHSFGYGAFANAIYYFDTASARVALGGQANPISLPYFGVEAGLAINTKSTSGALLGQYGSLGVVMVAIRGTFGTGPPTATLDVGLKAPYSLYTGNFAFTDLANASGRPHRIDGAVAVADATAEFECAADPSLQSTLGRSERQALGRLWLEDARLEHSAVSAFLTLAGELAALGAPPSLVRRAIDAARDETAHTRLCLEAARRHTGLAWTLPPFRPAEAPRHSIDALVRESWEDGCLGEGIAARSAGEGAAYCRDGWTRSTLETIARDESRHADLAWRVLEWCVGLPGAAGEEARSALSRAVDRVRGFIPAPLPALKAGTLRAHGRITQKMSANIAQVALDASGRLARSMLSRVPASYRSART
jgi:hypothetical protein